MDSQLQGTVISSDVGRPLEYITHRLDYDGNAPCGLIREQPWGKNILIIALTGWGQREDQDRSRKAGFDHHHVKPVELEMLFRKDNFRTH
ncbi:MAG: hypothetical protein ABIP97_04415 [Chthoniobacterales bacterium]